MNKLLSVFLFSLLAILSAVAQPVNETKLDDVYTIVEQMPRFPGCEEINGSNADKKKCAEQKMLEFIYQNITYPNEARENGNEGMAVISFIVDKQGKITEAKVVRDPGGGCGKESLRIVNSMPDWIPGKQRGQAVKVQFNLPVRFKLEDSLEKSLEKLNEIPVYTGLSLVFCQDFAGEFFKASDLNSWADTEYDMNNLCGFESQVKKLEVTYVEENGTERSLESEGELTDPMRDYFRNAVPGSAIRMMISIERSGLRGKIIKVLLVE